VGHTPPNMARAAEAERQRPTVQHQEANNQGGMIYSRPPTIETESLPSEEGLIVSWNLRNSLVRLFVHARDFEAALGLFDFANEHLTSPTLSNEQASMLKEWVRLAGRDGAMSIYHFGMTLRATQKLIFRDCPVLSSRLGNAKSKFRTVNKSFNRTFPRWEKLRQAVAHAAENFSDPDERPKHFVAGPLSIEGLPRQGGAETKIALYNVIAGRQFVYTFEKQVCSYQLSKESLNRLGEIRDMYYFIFGDRN
jgi:hypothetical protein